MRATSIDRPAAAVNSLVVFIAILTTLLSLSTMITFCSGGDLSTTAKVLFTQIDKGVTSGLGQRSFSVIRSIKDWRELWIAHTAAFSPPRALPSVDFGKEMIIAVSAGQKASGGFIIEIVDVEVNHPKQGLVVSVAETKPSADALTSQALTQPFHIVKLQRYDLKPQFVIR